MSAFEKDVEFSVEEDETDKKEIFGSKQRMEKVLLSGVGFNGGEYLPIFKHNGISFESFSDLTNEDLFSIGIINSDDRRRILNEIKILPFSKLGAGDVTAEGDECFNLSMVNQIARHLSLLTMSLHTSVLRASPSELVDPLVLPDTFSSVVALDSIQILNTKLKSIKNELNMNRKRYRKSYSPGRSNRPKKMAVTILGVGALLVLAYAIVKSLQNS